MCLSLKYQFGNYFFWLLLFNFSIILQTNEDAKWPTSFDLGEDLSILSLENERIERLSITC